MSEVKKKVEISWYMSGEFYAILLSRLWEKMREISAESPACFGAQYIHNF
jgi:hypothetical protein